MAEQKAFSEIRHEVYKFGLQGLDKKVQVNARYEQAIKLGAKPKSWIRPHINKAEQNQLELNNRQQDIKQLQDDNHHYQQTKQQKPRRKQKQKPKQTTRQIPRVKRKLKTSKS